MKNKSSHKHRQDKHHDRDKKHYQKGNFPPSPFAQKIEGQLIITSKGFGILKTSEIPETIKINENDLNTALNGDTVLVSLKSKRSEERVRAKVEQVISRAKTQFVGTITRERDFIYFKPDDRKFYKDLVILPNKNSEKVHPDEKVVVEMSPWTNPAQNPEGKIIQIIGKKGEHNVEIESIIYEKGFSPMFPKNVEDEAHKIKEIAGLDFEREITRRKSAPNPPPSGWDFRNVATFTIDPFDAKDFDDALSFRELEDETYEVGIHIADVTHYVKEGTAIDNEAIRRGTSVYLVDRTIPMLPEVLSNDLCSLKPNEDKLAYSVILQLNKNGDVLNRWIGQTIINSDKRFTYREAQDVLDNREGPFCNELVKLNAIAFKEHDVRTKNGSIIFGSVEVKFKLDEKGFPLEVYEKESLETNDLIEDFMLLANKEVAEYVDRLNEKESNVKHPFVYRIHDQPKEEKILDLNVFLRKIGYELKSHNGEITAKEINRLLNLIQGIEEESLIEKAILKSMAKAVYSTANIGHYGLGFRNYTHFTSPIRRYPDMMVHRLMKRYLRGDKIQEKEIEKYSRLSASSTRQEISAVEAERDSDKLKYAEYMSVRIGQEFDAMVSSIVDWGIYVQEVSTKAEGLVGLRTLKADRFEIDPKNYRIIGEKSGKTYTLGDAVKVKLIGVDINKRTIDFEIVE